MPWGRTVGGRKKPRGIFDKETRRKAQVYLADAVIEAGIMDIECCFMF
jgi:hypothetical protein